MKKIIVQLDAEKLKEKLNLKDGAVGPKGDSIKGDPGKDGYTPIKNVDYFDGAPGQDAVFDEEEVLKEFLSKVPKQTFELDDAYQIRDKLETLKDEDRVDASAIKNLPQFIEKSPIPNGGGWRNLFQLHDVLITSPSNGQTLVYNSATLKWENGSNGILTPLQEIPTGTINGINTTFVLSQVPVANTLLLIRDGITMFTLTGDYTILNKTITMTIAPHAGATLVAVYSY